MVSPHSEIFEALSESNKNSDFRTDPVDLITYCQREGIPFTAFHTFEDIFKKVKDVVEGRATTEKIAAEGLILAEQEGEEEITFK